MLFHPYQITGVCPCSSFEVYSFASKNGAVLPPNIVGTYHIDKDSAFERRTYKKSDNLNVIILYSNARKSWLIKEKNGANTKILALQTIQSTADICLSDTMHIEWGKLDDAGTNIVPFTDIKLRHRCQGVYAFKSPFFSLNSY